MRIIIADPDTAFRQICVALLQDQGCTVIEAATSEQAQRLLNAGWFHIAIICVQMETPDDPRDQSGLLLARHAHSVPKIMVSRFPSLDMVVEIMRPGVGHSPLAVNFLDKAERNKIVPAVTEAVHDLVPINWELTIRCLDGLSLLYLADHISQAVDRAALMNYADELEDLFRRLFYQNRQITLKRAFVLNEASLAVETLAYNEDTEERLIVVIDRPTEAVIPKRSAFRMEETTHFRAVAVMLHEGENLISFLEWYPAQSLDDIRRALNALFQIIVAQFNERSPRQEADLDQFYLGRMGLLEETLPDNQLNERINALCHEAMATGLVQLVPQGRRLTLYLPQGTTIDYLNPVYYLAEQAAAPPVPFGTTYEQLNPDSILIQSENMIRSLPVSGSGSGPLVHDLARFELSLHLRLVSDLTKRLEVETFLLGAAGPDDFRVSLSTMPPEPQHTAAVINLVRQFATRQWASYYTALFFNALVYVSTYDPALRHTREELTNYLHALLIAALISQRQRRHDTLPDDAPGDARHKLWIDLKTRMVWVEGIHTPVTPQEFDILSYLYAHEGKPCSREAILREALGEAVDDLFVEQSRLDSAMSRLRSKIEPDPKQPRYLLTIRGHGYQLK